MPVPEHGRVAPTTQQQRAVWAAQKINPAGDAYHVPVAYRLSGNTDVAALRSSLRLLLHRHPVLRTSFDDEDGALVQRVHGVPEDVLAVHDVSDGDWAEHVERAARAPFATDSGLRVQAHLFRRGPQDSVLLLSLDHTAVDAPSISLLLADLSEFYAAARDGGAALTPGPVESGYFDYARRQGEFVSSPEGGEHADFWAGYVRGLDGMPGGWTAATPSGAPGRTASVAVEVPDSFGGGCDSLGITPFCALLAAWSLTLQHYFRSDDLLIGYPAVDWRRSRYPRVVGLYSEMLPFRPPHRKGLSAGDYAGQVQDAVLDCLARQGASLSSMWAALRASQPPGAAAGFPALVSFNDTPDEGLRLPGVVTERIPLLPRDGKAGLLLSVNARGGGFTGRLDFVAAQHPPYVAERLARAFERVLGQLLSEPARAVLELELACPSDRDKALAGAVADTGTHPAPLVTEAFLARAAARPHAVALVEDGRETTYGELEETSRRLAARIGALGLPARSTVALCLPRSASFVTAALAVLRSGMAYLPIDMEQPARRRSFVMSDAGAAAALVVDDDARAQLPADLPVVDVRTADDPDGTADGPDGTADNPDAAPRFAESVPDVDAPAYLITTSGSTGLPKAVVVPHRAIANNLAWKRQQFAFGPEDRFYFKTPPVFDASLWEYLAPLTCGASVVVAHRTAHRDPSRLLHDMRHHSVTVAQFVPTLLKALLAEGTLGECTALRWIFAGGEQLDRAVVEALGRVSTAGVVNLYGPTEATIDATFHICAPDDASGPAMPIGRPVDGARAHVLGAGGQILPPGFVGELHLGGIVLADGYVNRDQLTAERFVPSPIREDRPTEAEPPRLYRTGDLARLRDDGLLEFLGREDGQVKVRGLRVDLDGIRSLLLEHPRVSDAAVTVHPEQRDTLVGYVVAPSSTGTGDIRAHLTERLPAEQLPAHLVCLDRLPVTATGKADIRALPVPQAGQQAAADARPRTALEHLLTRLWAEALGVPEGRVPRSVSLFELGGSSLTLIRLHSSIRREVSADVPITDLFKYPTVSTLAGALSRSGRTQHEGGRT